MWLACVHTFAGVFLPESTTLNFTLLLEGIIFRCGSSIGLICQVREPGFLLSAKTRSQALALRCSRWRRFADQMTKRGVNSGFAGEHQEGSVRYWISFADHLPHYRSAEGPQILPVLTTFHQNSFAIVLVLLFLIKKAPIHLAAC